MHPIAGLQAALVTALEADTALVALIGAGGVFDAPPRSRPAPYVVIDRHDTRGRDGDEAPGQEHRVLLHCWADQPSRKAALEIADRVVAVGLALGSAEPVVTHREVLRTETAIDAVTGQARAAVTLRFFSE
jgi:electron transfer flavoprotein alpha subunit